MPFFCTSMKPISALTMSCGPHGRKSAAKNKCRRSAIIPTYRCLARSTSTMAKRCFIQRPLSMLRRSWILGECSKSVSRPSHGLGVGSRPHSPCQHGQGVLAGRRAVFSLSFPSSLFATAEPDRTLVEMAERHRDRQCVSQKSKRYRPGHCSVCGRHPRTSGGSAATLRVCRMTEKLTLHVACI